MHVGGGYLADEVLVLPMDDRAGRVDGRVRVQLARRADQHALRAGLAQPARQRARVETRDGRNPRRSQQLDQLARRLEHGSGGVADDQAAQPGPATLIVERDATVVADQRVGHQHHLTGVRGVGADLLVAGRAGVGDKVAAARDGRPKSNAAEDRAVLEREQGGAGCAESGIDDRIGWDRERGSARQKETTARG